MVVDCLTDVTKAEQEGKVGAKHPSQEGNRDVLTREPTSIIPASQQGRQGENKKLAVAKAERFNLKGRAVAR